MIDVDVFISSDLWNYFKYGMSHSATNTSTAQHTKLEQIPSSKQKNKNEMQILRMASMQHCLFLRFISTREMIYHSSIMHTVHYNSLYELFVGWIWTILDIYIVLRKITLHNAHENCQVCAPKALLSSPFTHERVETYARRHAVKCLVDSRKANNTFSFPKRRTISVVAAKFTVIPHKINVFLPHTKRSQPVHIHIYTVITSQIMISVFGSAE